MAKMFTSKTECREYVKDAIGATWQDFDIDAIVEEAFERTSDGWTIEDPDDDFWSIVESHDVSEA